MSLARFDLPGDPGFPRELSNLYTKPASTADATTMRNYLVQLRTELGTRLLDRVYATDKDQPSKVELVYFNLAIITYSFHFPVENTIMQQVIFGHVNEFALTGCRQS